MATPTILVQPSSGASYTVDRALLEQASSVVRDLLQDVNNADEIVLPLPSIEDAALKLVVQYCSAPTEFDWGALSRVALFDLLHAANYLDISDLFDACCKQVAEHVAGKTPAAIVEWFGLDPGDANDWEDEVDF